MSGILLTVGIPTRNRAECLRVALESVFSQLHTVQAKVEILVCDNASAYDTSLVVGEFFLARPDLVRYRHHTTDVGFSRNVDFVFTHARGQYVLLLSDDDALEPGALKTICNTLTLRNEIGVMFVSERAYDQTLTQPLLKDDHRAYYYYTLAMMYVKHHGFPPSLVSGYVVRKDLWLKANASRYYNTLIGHVLTVLRIMTQSRCAVYVCGSQGIKYRTGNTGATCAEDPLFPFVFHLECLIGFDIVRPYVESKVSKRMHRQVMRSIAYHIMHQKASGHAISSQLASRLWASAYRRDPLLWLNYALLYAPRCCASIMLIIAASACVATKWLVARKPRGLMSRLTDIG